MTSCSGSIYGGGPYPGCIYGGGHYQEGAGCRVYLLSRQNNRSAPKNALTLCSCSRQLGALHGQWLESKPDLCHCCSAKVLSSPSLVRVHAVHAFIHAASTPANAVCVLQGKSVSHSNRLLTLSEGPARLVGPQLPNPLEPPSGQILSSAGSLSGSILLYNPQRTVLTGTYFFESPLAHLDVCAHLFLVLAALLHPGLSTAERVKQRVQQQ